MTDPVMLPSSPALRTDKVRMLDWGGQLVPPNGGEVQTLLRIGTRHALEFTLPPMRTEPLGRQWSVALRLGKLFGVMLPFGQDGFDIGAPGNIVVDGDGQAGMTLEVRGGTPRYHARLGQAFSLVSGGRRRLYFMAANATLDSSGAGALPIFPMLRKLPADGDVCEFARPIIQGNLSGNEVAWDRLTAPWSDFGTITITEAG